MLSDHIPDLHKVVLSIWSKLLEVYGFVDDIDWSDITAIDTVVDTINSVVSTINTNVTTLLNMFISLNSDFTAMCNKLIENVLDHIINTDSVKKKVFNAMNEILNPEVSLI